MPPALTELYSADCSRVNAETCRDLACRTCRRSDREDHLRRQLRRSIQLADRTRAAAFASHVDHVVAL
jgi:hypothetical protein